MLTTSVAMAATNLPNPILFVTQVPVAEDFATIGSVFANHLADMQSAARGGDLWIRYPNGNLRNLTAEAGFGVSPHPTSGRSIPAPSWGAWLGHAIGQFAVQRGRLSHRR